MELKIEGDTFTLSGKSTPQELLQAMKALADQYANATASRTTDTGEAILPGLDRFDARASGTGVQIGIRAAFGWVLLQIDLPAACALSGQLVLGVRDSLQTTHAQAEVLQAKPLIQ